MKDEISHLSSKKALVSMSRGAVEPSSMENPTMPSSNPETPLFVECIRRSFTNESDLDESESCFEFNPHSPDSIFDESNIFGLSDKSRLGNPTLDSIRVKNSKGVSCDLTLGEVVQELCLHLQPVLVSTIKEVLTESISSINGTKPTDSSTASASLSNDSQASSFVNYSVDEEMKEMKKILDNPWNPDETFDISRLQIETMDSWKKNFGRLIFEDKKEPLNAEDTNQNSGAIVSTSNLNQTSQVQYHSPVQAERKAISIQKKDQATVKSRKLFRVYIIYVLIMIILVVAAMTTFVVLELDFYGGHTAREREDAIWLRLRRCPQFFLSSNFG